MPKIEVYETNLLKSDDNLRLEIHKNANGNLFICLESPVNDTCEFIELPASDAVEIVRNLANEFDIKFNG